MEADPDAVVRFLGKLMAETGLSAAGLADAAGCSHQSVYGWLVPTRTPELDRLYCICDAVGRPDLKPDARTAWVSVKAPPVEPEAA